MSEVALEPVPPLAKTVVALPFVWLQTARYAAYASIYAALLVYAVPPWEPLWFAARLNSFFVALALAHLLGLGLDGVRTGSFWAWLAPLLVFVAQPSATGLIAIPSLGLLGALEARKLRLGTKHVARDGLLVLAVFAALVLTVTLPVPRAGIARSQPVAPINLQKPEEFTGAGRPSVVQVRRQREMTELDVQIGLLESVKKTSLVVNSALLAFLLSLIVLSLRTRLRDPQARNIWADFVPLIGAAVLGVMIFAYGLSASSGGGGAGSAGMNGRSPVNGDATPGTASVRAGQTGAAENPWPTALLSLLAAATVAWLMLRRSRTDKMVDPEPSATSANLEPETATNRVREAYRAFLRLCIRAGLGRLETETPLEFAQRLGQTQTLALRPASDLTALYEPVRYGGCSDTAGALAAERALESLRNILQVDQKINRGEQHD
jgi:Domain of unknown function (DUF4129)